jgi:hypothetical protein
MTAALRIEARFSWPRSRTRDAMIDSLAVLACRRARPAAMVRRAEGLSLSVATENSIGGPLALSRH